MDASSGSVSLHILPQSVRTAEDLEDYIHLTLEVGSDSDWIAAEKIVLSDFRIKNPKRWSRKGRCPSCGVSTGSRHGKSCKPQAAGTGANR